MSGNDPLAGLRAADFWEEQGDHSQEIFLAIARLIKQRLTEAGVKDDGSGRKYATVDIPVSELKVLGAQPQTIGTLFLRIAKECGYSVTSLDGRGWPLVPFEELTYVRFTTFQPLPR